MQGLRLANSALLHDTAGAVVGAMGTDGKEYLFTTVLNGAAVPQPAIYVPSAAAITGGTARGLTDLGAVRSDISGVPGNGTANTISGRAAFAAAGTTVVVTNSKATATSKVFVQLGGADATLISVRVTAAAGGFTVTGNAAATGIVPFDFLVVN